MKSQKSKIFKDAFLKVIKEDITSATSGMGPTAAENTDQFSKDSYAPGDNRIPTALGAKKNKKNQIPIQRRNKSGM